MPKRFVIFFLTCAIWLTMDESYPSTEPCGITNAIVKKKKKTGKRNIRTYDKTSIGQRKLRSSIASFVSPIACILEITILWSTFRGLFEDL